MDASQEWRMVIWITFAQKRFSSCIMYSGITIFTVAPDVHSCHPFLCRACKESRLHLLRTRLARSQRWILCAQRSYRSMRLYVCAKYLERHCVVVKQKVTDWSIVKETYRRIYRDTYYKNSYLTHPCFNVSCKAAADLLVFQTAHLSSQVWPQHVFVCIIRYGICPDLHAVHRLTKRTYSERHTNLTSSHRV